MKRIALKVSLSLLAAATLLAGCEVKQLEYDKYPPDDEQFTGIFGISLRNFPRIDGSVSTHELARVSAYKLLSLRYCWIGTDDDRNVDFSREGLSDEIQDAILGLVRTSQTHEAFVNLIDGRVDVILTDRTMLPEEKTRADASGVSLLEAPVAFDPLLSVPQVYVAIRSGIPHGEMAVRLYQWFQSESARSTIAECGFIPK